jgi:hypothetical protein
MNGGVAAGLTVEVEDRVDEGVVVVVTGTGVEGTAV